MHRLFLTIAAFCMISCTAERIRTQTAAEGWLDEHTYRASGIGYPDPYDSTRDAKRKSAARAARDIAIAAIDYALTMNMNAENAARMRAFLAANAAVVKHIDQADGRAEMTLELYHPGLKAIAGSGNAGALP